MVKLNLTGVGTAPEPVEPAVYTGRFTGHKVVLESKASGQPYLNTEITLEGAAPSGGKKLFGIVSLQQQSLWAFKLFCVKLGVTEAELDKDFDVDELLNPYHGALVNVDVGVEDAKDRDGNPNGNKRNVIKRYMAVDEVVPAKATPF